MIVQNENRAEFMLPMRALAINIYHVHPYIFTFSKQTFNEPLDFATIHSLMKDMNMIVRSQAHLPV